MDCCIESLTHCSGDVDNDNLELALIYNSTGRMHMRYKQYEEAAEWFEKALKIREKQLGKDHPSTVATRERVEVMNALAKPRNNGKP